MVEHQPSKLDTWVRFPSPALFFCPFAGCAGDANRTCGSVSASLRSVPNRCHRHLAPHHPLYFFALLQILHFIKEPSRVCGKVLLVISCKHSSAVPISKSFAFFAAGQSPYQPKSKSHLPLLVAFARFFCLFSRMVLSIIAGAFFLFGVLMLFIGEWQGFIGFSLLAWAISPYGLPGAASWLTERMDDINSMLKAI